MPGAAGFPLLEPELIVADRRWHRLVPGARLVVARAARLGGGAGSVLLTTGGAVRRLNARYRGRNASTNVLTFEAAVGEPGGDIVLAFDVVRHEAQAAGRRPAHHLAHLVLHGALHLRGHDHHGAGEARRMELREAWLLARMRVPNPWGPGPCRPTPAVPGRPAPHDRLDTIGRLPPATIPALFRPGPPAAVSRP